MNDCITTTKQSTTKPCAYFLGYTVYVNHRSVYDLTKHRINLYIFWYMLDLKTIVFQMWYVTITNATLKAVAAYEQIDSAMSYLSSHVKDVVTAVHLVEDL